MGVVGLLQYPLHGEQYLDGYRPTGMVCAAMQRRNLEALEVEATTEQSSNQAVQEPVRAIK